LKHDIRAERITEAGDEQLDLLRLQQRCIATGQGDEALGVIIHRVRASQHGELIDGAVDEWWPELCIHELHKLWPSQLTAIRFHSIEPQLGIVQQVEGSESDPLVLRCAANVEVSLTVIEPWKRIIGAVEFWKLEFVGRRGKILAGGSIIIVPLVRWAWRACPALGIRGGLRLGQLVDS
jgi:hypothetical protein